jgi:hypothetical protein
MLPSLTVAFIAGLLVRIADSLFSPVRFIPALFRCTRRLRANDSTTSSARRLALRSTLSRGRLLGGGCQPGCP